LEGRLDAAGVPVTWEDALLPIRRVYAEDPLGNRLELTAG
jgi:hypothetical protein